MREVRGCLREVRVYREYTADVGYMGEVWGVYSGCKTKARVYEGGMGVWWVFEGSMGSIQRMWEKSGYMREVKAYMREVRGCVREVRVYREYTADVG